MDIRSALSFATLDLKHHGSVTPRLDAEILLSHCMKTDRLSLYTHPEKTMTEDELYQYRLCLARRSGGEPVAYIIGRKEFWSLSFEVNQNVLIPRPETEMLVEAILRRYSDAADRHLMILEIGTGSGAISVALATELKNAGIVATDVSPDALDVAIENARKNGVEHQISFRLGSLFEPVTEKFDVIVSNPPYISSELFESLPVGVRDFEPGLALVSGRDGTEFHRNILMQGCHYLKEEGRLFLEIGADQKNKIAEMVSTLNLYDEITFIFDYTGIERVFMARWKGGFSHG